MGTYTGNNQNNNNNSNVVLLDSDSDSELQHVSKKQKPLPSVQATEFTKPLMQDSESDNESDSDVDTESEGNNKADGHSGDDTHRPTGAINGYGFQFPLNDTNATDTSSSNMSSPGQAVPSDSLSNESADSSALEEILPVDLDEDPREPGESGENSIPGNKRALLHLAPPKKWTVFESRRFLKTRGPMAFLQEYLPPTASSEDILELITKLGFAPRHMPPLLEGENLLELIKLLHLAMKRVRLLRSRLDDFHTENHVLLKLKSASKVLVLTGAGISTSLGIPDFRSSKGFYSRLTNLGLSDPQEVFDLDIFRTDPSIFYSIAHMILPPDNVYAPLHRFIRLLQDKGKLLRNYTQNIDNLEANAGIDPEKMIQCHGSFAFATCVTCGYKVKGQTLYPLIREKEIAYCPDCTPNRIRLQDLDAYVEESYGVMKPDITFFGEALPRLFHDNILQDIRNCDLLISIGTSLKVAPVADIVDKVPAEVPQILINRDPIHHCNFDVSMLGHCDDVVSYLCDKLGEEWAIDHESYPSLVGKDHDNLFIQLADERGVYNIRNKKRELEDEALKKENEPSPVPDLIMLEPSLN